MKSNLDTGKTEATLKWPIQSSSGEEKKHFHLKQLINQYFKKTLD